MKFFYLCLLLPLAGCATSEKYEAILDSWIGGTEKQLIRSWGAPDSVYESGDEKYLSYHDSKSGYVPGIAPTYQTQVIGNTAYTTKSGGTQGYFYNNHCQTTFTISGGVIKHWRYEGNSCKSN